MVSCCKKVFLNSNLTFIHFYLTGIRYGKDKNEVKLKPKKFDKTFFLISSSGPFCQT